MMRLYSCLDFCLWANNENGAARASAGNSLCWIPAYAGMTNSLRRIHCSPVWIPAYAGMTTDRPLPERLRCWIPAYAGMTESRFLFHFCFQLDSRLRGNDGYAGNDGYVGNGAGRQGRGLWLVLDRMYDHDC